MKKKIEKKEIKENIKNVEFSEEMEQSYIDYSMSVITARAVPDIRDGLKPVQRRVLYAMSELGVKHNVSFKKCARIVGDAMGKYHPHGDSSIYETLVNMSKDWSYMNPLVDGHGNFGSIEGDGAAAMRYTEARLTEFAETLYLQDMEKGTVDFVSNFDNSEKEPEVLPVKLPNVLVNGADGIAVGMATKIPTHNLSEIIDGMLAYYKNPNITTAELMNYIKGPDFATGGIVSNQKDLLNIYEKGNGKIKIRGKATIETEKSGKQHIVITEIPQTMVGATDAFLERVASLYREKQIEITDIQNQSSGSDIRIVIDVKKNADAQNVLNVLYKKARLEDTFSMNMLVICNNIPKVLSLKGVIEEYVAFQKEIYRKKYEYLLNKEEHKREIREGLIKAVDCIDLIIEILRGSKTLKEAKSCLINGETGKIKFKTKKSENDAKKLCFTEAQADAILEMRLHRLIGLELDALKKDLSDAEKNIDKYNGYLTSAVKMRHLIEKELTEIKTKYGNQRKTELCDKDEIIIKKQELKESEIVAIMDRFGYIKAVDESAYDKSRGALEIEYKAEIRMKNTGKLLIFTDTGKMYTIKGSVLPMSKIKDKGIPIDNIAGMNFAKENIIYICSYESIKNKQLGFITSKGMIKTVNGDQFDVSKKVTDSTKLNDGDRLVSVVEINNEPDCIIGTEDGRFLRMKMRNIKNYKKSGVGTKSINVESGEVKYFKLGNSETIFEEDDYKFDFGEVKTGKSGAKGTKIHSSQLPTT